MENKGLTGHVQEIEPGILRGLPGRPRDRGPGRQQRFHAADTAASQALRVHLNHLPAGLKWFNSAIFYFAAARPKISGLRFGDSRGKLRSLWKRKN